MRINREIRAPRLRVITEAGDQLGILSLREALEKAEEIGTVAVEMGGTSCKVPDALESLQKVAAKASVGKKRKTVKC